MRGSWIVATLVLSAVLQGVHSRRYDCVENNGVGVREDECDFSEECSRPVPCTCPADFSFDRSTGLCEVKSRRRSKKPKERSLAMTTSPVPSQQPVQMMPFLPPLPPPPPPMMQMYPPYHPYPMMPFMPAPAMPASGPPVYIFVPSATEINNGTSSPAEVQANKTTAGTVKTSSTALVTKATATTATTKKVSEEEEPHNKDDNQQQGNDESEENNTAVYPETTTAPQAGQTRRKNKANKLKWPKPEHGRKGTRKSIFKKKQPKGPDIGLEKSKVAQQNFYPVPSKNIQTNRRAKNGPSPAKSEKLIKENGTVINQNLISINNYGDHVSVFLKRLEDQTGILSAADIKQRLIDLGNVNKKEMRRNADLLQWKIFETTKEDNKKLKNQEFDNVNQQQSALAALVEQLYRMKNLTPAVDTYKKQSHILPHASDEGIMKIYKHMPYSSENVTFDIYPQDGTKPYNSEAIPKFRKNTVSSFFPKLSTQTKRRFGHVPMSQYVMQDTRFSGDYIPNYRNKFTSDDSNTDPLTHRMRDYNHAPEEHKNERQINMLVRNIYLQKANNALANKRKLEIFDSKLDVLDELAA